MVNAGWKSSLAVLLLAAAALTATAALRSAEYDEQYTLFLTAGVARPVWPTTPFVAGDVRALQAGHATLAGIARDLRATDVHPPLYFWSVALWRRLWGGGLLVARLFSVLCSVAALAAVGLVARQVGVPAALAMLLSLGCYGFAYTGAIARGFALAQALTVWGVAASLGRGRWCAAGAGVLLGAATFANYLAVFVAIAAVGARVADGRFEPGRGRGRASTAQATGWRCLRSEGVAAAVIIARAMLPFLLADLWFFLAQRSSRAEQFPAFHVLGALQRLVRCTAGALFGGLPLYVPDAVQPLALAGLATLGLACVAVVGLRWRQIAAAASGRRLLLIAAGAPPAGLLLLGFACNNIPIELRYLAFAVPFAALLLAGALGSVPGRWRTAATAVVVCVQAAALAGLILRPETMQPARTSAAAAARWAAGGIVLVPRGNDGVGVVGAFALESPPAQRLLVVVAGESPAEVSARIGRADRVALALIAQDDASRAALSVMRAAVAGPGWRPVGRGFNTAGFKRVCEAGAQCAAASRDR